MASAIIINAWVSHLSAVELLTEFYTAEAKPKEYAGLGEGDCTVIRIKGWPIVQILQSQRFCHR